MLHDKLKELDRYPFHMPGHKRNQKFNIAGSEIDITEIDGFDNLHCPKGVIAQTEKQLSEIYKSKHSFMLINGTTVGILSAVFAVLNEGDTVIVAVNCHKSVFNACLLRKLQIVLLYPNFDKDNGFYKSISQEEVDRVCREHKEAKAVIITSPTYEGYVSNISCTLPIIVDCAHGAHFSLGKFPNYPNGDIVISSLHKTLPALTQCAVANIYNEEYTDKVKYYLDIFETSSPSYVLMNSVSICTDFVRNNADDFTKFCKSLEKFYKNTHLSNLNLIISDDISKIIISTYKCNINGEKLAEILRLDYNFEPEMVSSEYVLLITTVADSEDILNKLSDCLCEIDSKLKAKQKPPFCESKKSREKLTITLSDSFEKSELINSAGKICNEFVYAYPPDIPVLFPGKKIEDSDINQILRLYESGVNLISDSDLLPRYILTKKNY